MSRLRRRMGRCSVLALAALIASASAPTFAENTEDLSDVGQSEDQWRFRVLLDGKTIGFHYYDVAQVGQRRVVETRAEFDVKIFFINAYRYRHSLRSTWDGGCLESLESNTDANGEAVSVIGKRSGNQFLVDSGSSETALPACVMNFAYWDPRILEQTSLLNPQTGEYLDVSVNRLGEQELLLDGVSVEADAYRITGKNLRIDLWYAKGTRQWIALESLTESDRVIRYERENENA